MHVRLIGLKWEYELRMVLSEKTELSNDIYILVFTCTFISDLYLALKKDKDHIRYSECARKLCESTEYTELLVRTCDLYGMYYSSNYEEIKALEAYLGLLDVVKKYQNLTLASSAYDNITTCFELKRNYIEATHYYKKCYELLQSMEKNSAYSKAIMLSNLCNYEYRLKDVVALRAYSPRFEDSDRQSSEESMSLLYLFYKLMYLRLHEAVSVQAVMEELLVEQEKVENRLPAYQILKNICSTMLEIDNQSYSEGPLEILQAIEDGDDIKSRRRFQKLIVNYYEKFSTKEKLLQAYREFYTITLTVEGTDMEDNSSGPTVALELYRTKERQVSLEKGNERLERPINIDDLTNAYDRRCLNESVTAIDLQKEKTMTVATPGTDYLEEYNDICGYQMGDRALVKIGRCMKQYEKEREIQFYRYGGDGFSATFIRQSEESVRKTMTALTHDIREQEIPYKGPRTTQISTLPFDYVFSSQEPVDMAVLIRQANEQLYQHRELCRQRCKRIDVVTGNVQ